MPLSDRGQAKSNAAFFRRDMSPTPMVDRRGQAKSNAAFFRRDMSPTPMVDRVVLGMSSAEEKISARPSVE